MPEPHEPRRCHGFSAENPEKPCPQPVPYGLRRYHSIGCRELARNRRRKTAAARAQNVTGVRRYRRIHSRELRLVGLAERLRSRLARLTAGSVTVPRAPLVGSMRSVAPMTRVPLVSSFGLDQDAEGRCHVLILCLWCLEQSVTVPGDASPTRESTVEMLRSISSAALKDLGARHHDVVSQTRPRELKTIPIAVSQDCNLSTLPRLSVPLVMGICAWIYFEPIDDASLSMSEIVRGGIRKSS